MVNHDYDLVSEEMNIMDERDKAPKMLSAEIFHFPIKMLNHLPCHALDISVTVGEVIEFLQKEKHGAVIITKAGKLAGIVSERDFLTKALGKIQDFQDKPVETIWTPNPSWLKIDDPIAHLMNKMEVGKYRHVPIVDNEMRPVSLVSLRQVLSFILENFPEEVINLTPEPYRGKPVRETI